MMQSFNNFTYFHGSKLEKVIELFQNQILSNHRKSFLSTNVNSQHKLQG